MIETFVNDTSPAFFRLMRVVLVSAKSVRNAVVYIFPFQDVPRTHKNVIEEFCQIGRLEII